MSRVRLPLAARPVQGMTKHWYRLGRKIVLREVLHVECQSIVHRSDLALAEQKLDVGLVAPSPASPHLHGQQGAHVSYDHLDAPHFDDGSPFGLAGYREVHL